MKKIAISFFVLMFTMVIFISPLKAEVKTEKKLNTTSVSFDKKVVDFLKTAKESSFTKITDLMSNKNSKPNVDQLLLIILCFLLPWLAVGLKTNWDTLYTILAVLLWLCGWIPGTIFALLVVLDVV